jgi:carbon-monoxide dehydrogenase small subunit
VVSDVPTVVSCIPGASLDAAPDSDLLSGRCVVSAGLLRATFRGTALLQLDPAARCGRIAGLGRDALSRSELSGSLDFSLTSEAEAETRLDLTMVYRLKGPLAQFSRPALVEEIADQLLAEVSANIAARAKGAEVAAGETLSGFGLLGGLLKRLFNRLPGLR